MWLPLLFACAVVHLPDPSEAMVAAAQTRAADASLDTLTTGRTLVLRRCAGCHTLPEPADSTTDDWPDVFVTMTKKAKLTPEQARLIETYLQASAALPEPLEGRGKPSPPPPQPSGS